MKCPDCKGCFDKVVIKSTRFLYCFLCKKYYIIDEKQKLVEVDIEKECNDENRESAEHI